MERILDDRESKFEIDMDIKPLNNKKNIITTNSTQILNKLENFQPINN